MVGVVWWGARRALPSTWPLHFQNYSPKVCRNKLSAQVRCCADVHAMQLVEKEYAELELRSIQHQVCLPEHPVPVRILRPSQTLNFLESIFNSIVVGEVFIVLTYELPIYYLLSHRHTCFTYLKSLSQNVRNFVFAFVRFNQSFLFFPLDFIFSSRCHLVSIL